MNPFATNTKNNIVWARRKGDVPPAEVDQYSPKVQVWGGISQHGKTRLVLYKGSLDTDKYCDVILKKAKPDFATIFGAGNTAWTFVHDGASAHKAAPTNTWLTRNVPRFITSGPDGDWPAKSPDLNIIEQVWGIIEGELDKKRPKTLATLKTRVREIWDSLDIDIVRKQVKSMKTRLKFIINSGGEWTPN